MRMTCTREQLARLQKGIDLGKAPDLARRDAPKNVHGPELARVGEAGRSDQVGQGRQGVVVELAHACGLVVDDDRPLTPRILGRNASGTTIGVTGLRLHAA